ncbi:RES family NAD+ phosphorylase [Pseudomonas sp. ICMP 561]|uniref:RES family NAD+ phosphorylase n=1 Tax=Pseudomonas sp. ICMP 561 TaxID=1718918 RepID=UPI00211D98DF|nr:RES family NAD+ phosphorylase [Pseudomonas sp. ICMP 561]
MPLSEIVSLVEGILDKYIYEGESRHWCNGNPVIDRPAGKSVEYWVREIFGCDHSEPIVSAVCAHLTRYQRDIEYPKSSFLPHHIGLQWGEFQHRVKHANRFFNESAKEFLDWVFEGLGSYSASSAEHAVVRELTPENTPPIFRARTCMTSEVVHEIASDPARNLSAPPKERAGEGRMNPAGVPAFYGAFERSTCVAELRPPVGATVVSGEFKLNGKVRVLDFRRFENADLGPMPSFFDPQYFQKIARRDFLDYLHNAITVPVLPGSESSYLISQVIAEYLYSHCDPKMDGVIFKSVQETSGSNIVLFSHVASAATPLMWHWKGARGARGAVGSGAPRIEYVNGSLQRHVIRGVVYDDIVQPIPDDEAKAEAPASYGR